MSDVMADPAGAQLKGLEGEELSAVTFVRDYVQLQFDGQTITAVTLPIVIDAAGRHEFGAQGYRDCLCALIGRTIVRAEARPGESLQVGFDEHSSIEISLDPSSYRAAEAAILSDNRGNTLAVW